MNKVNYSKVKVDKVLLFPPQPIIVEPDQLHRQDLGQLDNVKFLPAFSATLASWTRVRHHFRFQEGLYALL